MTIIRNDKKMFTVQLLVECFSFSFGAQYGPIHKAKNFPPQYFNENSQCQIVVDKDVND
jgi:hypothetical protein